MGSHFKYKKLLSYVFYLIVNIQTEKLPSLKIFLFRGELSFFVTNESFILASWSDRNFFQFIVYSLFTNIIKYDYSLLFLFFFRCVKIKLRHH